MAMTPIPAFYRRLGRWCVFASGLACLLFCSSCKKSVPAGTTGTRMPLSDGLYLKYSASLVSEGTHVTDEYQYEFHALDKGRWHVTETGGEYNTGSTQSLIIDSEGTVVQDDGTSAKGSIGKKFNGVWLAPSERKKGNVFHPLYDFGDFTVGPATAWEKWPVIPAVCTGEVTVTRYYEATTGWLVGIQFNRASDERVDTLTATNAAIP